VKMIIQECKSFTINTAKERKRINEVFKDRGDIKVKLLELMDLVEQQKWKEASVELEREWWQGEDEHGCPRLEFIGLLEAESCSGLEWCYDSYDVLIWRMNNRPDMYKVVEVK